MSPLQTPSSVMPPRNRANLIYGGIDNHIHRYSYGQVTSFQFFIQPSIFILISIAYSILLLFTWLQLNFFTVALFFVDDYFQNLVFQLLYYFFWNFLLPYEPLFEVLSHYFCLLLRYYSKSKLLYPHFGPKNTHTNSSAIF